MRVIMFSTRSYEQERYVKASQAQYELKMVVERLSVSTVQMAQGYDVLVVFVADDLSRDVLTELAAIGVKLIVCRSAGVDHVDVDAAKELGLQVANCPKYSPAAVAEFAVGLLLALNRKIVHAHEQMLRHDFTVDKLLGFELSGRTVGIIGTGHIGEAFARIMAGFGCRLLAYDPMQNPNCIKVGVEYLPQAAVLKQADFISLHTPLLPVTQHLLDADRLALMKPGVLIVNTARGAVVDTQAMMAAIESGHVGGYAADVYEFESGVYFEDYSDRDLDDPLLTKLLAMKQVLLTPHQAFFTVRALENIAACVFENIAGFVEKSKPAYGV